MKVSEVIQHLENFAPLYYQESYDNAGLITGDSLWECSGIIIALDATEEVIKEAVEKKCNLVVAHHPIVFKGLKKINGKNFVEKAIIAAIKNDIAVYAIHTNLDNVKKGVNKKIADKLNLINLKILQPKEALLKKLVTFVPIDEAEKLRVALFSAGGGHIGNYSECSFNTEGAGTFKPEEGADPFVGEIGRRHQETEVKIEIIFPGYLQDKLIAAMFEAHPYEEVAYDIFQLDNFLSDVGSGLIGELEEEMEENDLLQLIKTSFGLKVIRHTLLTGRKVKKVGVCGGAGSFLIPAALANQADVYITSDIKYHEFFDAEDKMVIADIGHYESEQFTIELLHEILSEKYPNFAVRKTDVITNPVHYFS